MKTKNNIKDPFPLRAIRWSFPKLELIVPSIAYKIAWNLFFSPFRFKRPEREENAFQTAKLSSVSINNKEVKIFEWGTNGNPVAVMVHGWSGRATQFFKFIDPLIQAGFHVVAFDAPAHGLSEGKSTHMVEFYEALAHIEKKMGTLKVGIGHSFGGVSLLFSKKQGLNIDTTIMIGSPTVGEDILTGFRKKINASPKTAIAMRKKVIKNFDIDFEDITACVIAKDLTIKNHLIVHDKDDLEVPYQNAEALKYVSPQAQLILTNGLGHTRILRDDAVVDTVLNFIDSSVNQA